jgi:hypothetical protein
MDCVELYSVIGEGCAKRCFSTSIEDVVCLRIFKYGKDFNIFEIEECCADRLVKIGLPVRKVIAQEEEWDYIYRFCPAYYDITIEDISKPVIQKQIIHIFDLIYANNLHIEDLQIMQDEDENVVVVDWLCVRKGYTSFIYCKSNTWICIEKEMRGYSVTGSWNENILFRFC